MPGQTAPSCAKIARGGRAVQLPHEPHGVDDRAGRPAEASRRHRNPRRLWALPGARRSSAPPGLLPFFSSRERPNTGKLAFFRQGKGLLFGLGMVLFACVSPLSQLPAAARASRRVVQARAPHIHAGPSGFLHVTSTHTYTASRESHEKRILGAKQRKLKKNKSQIPIRYTSRCRSFYSFPHAQSNRGELSCYLSSL